jgi:hypothetical protein
MVLTAIAMSSYSPKNIPKQKIESMARDMGMIYPDEVKAFFEMDKK